MDPGSYDLNICGLKNYYEDVLEAWERWEEKPVDSDIRIGTIGEPTRHSEFLDVLERIKPKEYITDGRILGTLGDPRRIEHLDKTIDLGIKVILLWSDTPYCRRAYHDLKSSKGNVILGIKENPDEFLKTSWREDENYLLIPDYPASDDLKNKKNIKIMEYYQNILLTDNKIIITKNSINLKPLKVYDRV